MLPSSEPDQTNYQRIHTLRRIGWVVIGDQLITDQVLESVLERVSEPQRYKSLNDINDNEIARDVIAAYEGIVRGRGKITILNLPKELRALSAPQIRLRLGQLTFLQRIAVALVIVENYTLERAAELTDRPVGVLRNSLAEAVQILDIEVDENLI